MTALGVTSKVYMQCHCHMTHFQLYISEQFADEAIITIHMFQTGKNCNMKMAMKLPVLADSVTEMIAEIRPWES